MAPSEIEYENTFGKAVLSSFSFLKTYGFSLRQQYGWLFQAESKCCIVTIQMDRHQVFLDIRPVTIQDGQNEAVEPFDLGVIINCLYPEVDFKYTFDLKPQELHDETDRLSKLLLRYCEATLRGDFSVWPRLEACIKERQRKAAFAALRKREEDRVMHIKSEVVDAFHRKDYAKVIVMYEPIRHLLTPVETKRLEYAKKIANHK